jgi:hypothetical protein
MHTHMYKHIESACAGTYVYLVKILKDGMNDNKNFFPFTG